MGAWSVKLSSSDDFLDTKDLFFDYYFYDTLSIKEIEEKIIQDNAQSDNDSKTLYDAYFAIAECEWKCGCLSKEMSDEIERLIVGGKDLEHWKELGATPYVLQKRGAVLSEFLEKLRSKNPKPIKRKKKERFVFPLKTGDVFACYSRANKAWGCGIALEVRESQLKEWEEPYHFRVLLAISELTWAYLPIEDQVINSTVKDIFWDGGCSYTLPKWGIVVLDNVADRIDKDYSQYFGSFVENNRIYCGGTLRPKFDKLIAPGYKAMDRFAALKKPMKYYFDKNNLRTTIEVLQRHSNKV